MFGISVLTKQKPITLNFSVDNLPVSIQLASIKPAGDGKLENRIATGSNVLFPYQPAAQPSINRDACLSKIRPQRSLKWSSI